MNVLVLCTANINRSPMGEGLLRDLSAHAGVKVSSAGFLEDGRSASDNAITVMGRRGIDLSDHLSRRLTTDMIEAADLVVGMTREHVRGATLLERNAFDRIFSLKELLRLAVRAGERGTEPLDRYLGRLGGGRDPMALLGDSKHDDVADPVGQGVERFEKTAKELDLLCQALVQYVLVP